MKSEKKITFQIFPFSVSPWGFQKGQLFLALVGNTLIPHPHEQGPNSTCLDKLIIWHPPNLYFKNILSGWEAQLCGGRQQGLLLGKEDAWSLALRPPTPSPAADTVLPT